MIGDAALPHILSKQPHRVRKQWIQDRADKLKGINIVDKDLRVSKLIDKLNEKIKG